MRKRRVLLVLVLAIVMAGVAAFSTLKYLATNPASASRAPEAKLTQVVVAARDLPVGTFLQEQDVTVVPWPAQAVPAGYTTQVSDAVGRGIIAAVSANEPLLASKLAERGSGGGLPIVIPEGMRAMSIAVDQVVGVAGFVLPGTRVDVLLTIQPPDQDETITQIILQNLTVLTAGQITQKNEAGEPIVVNVVTVMVDPDQAERLSLASSQGRIQLALRNMLDVDAATTEGIRVSGLLDRPSAPRPVRRTVVRSTSPAPRQQPSVIEIYKGGTRSVERFNP
jgi:pilus assembly protein CpaB